jgi:hypothetical protein
MNSISQILLWCSIVFGVSAVAQGPSGPPAEVKALEWLTGQWEGDFNWNMMGVESDSKMTISAEWEGQFLKLVQTTEVPGMDKMIDNSYLGWDAKEKKYRMWSFSNYSPNPRIESGTLEGSKLVMTSEPWDTGMGDPITGRGTMTKRSENEIHFSLEFQMNGTWEKVGEGLLKKKPK